MLNSGTIIRISSIALLMAGIAGCGVGGTTYGTGVGQEKQTLNDISNMLTFSKKTAVIDYSARPDLVVPEDKQLVEPVDEATTTSNADWPESPEQRIARIRAEAEEAQSSPAKQVQFDQSQKKFQAESSKAGAGYEAPVGQGVPNVSCDPDGLIMRKCTSKEISLAVRAERKITATAGSGGRKYLTEPPDIYRTPAATAPSGEESYTEEELALLEKEKKLRKLEEERKLK